MLQKWDTLHSNKWTTLIFGDLRAVKYTVEYFKADSLFMLVQGVLSDIQHIKPHLRDSEGWYGIPAFYLEAESYEIYMAKLLLAYSRAYTAAYTSQ